jgi:hypothetical protein
MTAPLSGGVGRVKHVIHSDQYDRDGTVTLALQRH